jgi:hypothetical protein
MLATCLTAAGQLTITRTANDMPWLISAH